MEKFIHKTIFSNSLQNEKLFFPMQSFLQTSNLVSLLLCFLHVLKMYVFQNILREFIKSKLFNDNVEQGFQLPENSNFSYNSIDNEHYKLVKCNSQKNTDADYLVFLKKPHKFNETNTFTKV